MALPRKLKNFNVFLDGVSQIGVATEVALPKLTRKMEEIRAAGMNGPVSADLGMEKLEIEHTYGGFMREVYAQWGVTRVDSILLRFAGGYQRDDTGDVDAIEIVVRGRHSEIDAGNAKAGDDTTFKVTSQLSYYKLSVNGATVVEIDLLNMIEIIDGTDNLSAQRTAIGL